MKRSDDLFLLIRSMTRREKAYFKRYAGIYSDSDDRNYLRLFAAIDRMKIYDEEKLREQLAGDKLLKHLSGEKRYLYRLLLRCLTAYCSKESVWELKDRAELLLNRGLDAAGMKLIEKGLALARRKELFSIWLELLQLKIDRISSRRVSGLAPTIAELTGERFQVMRQMANYDNYVHMRFVAFDLMEAQGFVRHPDTDSEYHFLRDNPMLLDESKAISVRAKERYHYIRTLSFFLGREFVAWHRGYSEHVRIVEDNRELFEDRILLKLYMNYLLACIKVDDRDGFQRTLTTMDALPVRQPSDAAFYFGMRAVRCLHYSSNTGDMAMGMQELDVIARDEPKHFDNLDENTRMLLCYHCARMNMELGRFSEALDWIGRLRKLQGFSVTNPLIATVRIMEVMCHYELENSNLVEHHIRSLYRTLRKANFEDPLISTMMSCLRRVPVATTDSAVLQQLFLSLREEIISLSERQEDNRSLEYFHFEWWVESKIEGQPFAELLVERLTGQPSEPPTRRRIVSIGSATRGPA